MFVPELKSIPCSGNRVKSQMHWRFQTLGTPAARMRFVEKTLERDVFLYFCNNRSTAKIAPLLFTRSAERFSALGGAPVSRFFASFSLPVPPAWSPAKSRRNSEFQLP